MHNYFEKLVVSPEIRPMPNLGCLFDVQTGSHYVGHYGETILNGGLNNVTAVAGRGNMFKTVVMLFMFLRVLDRYSPSVGMIYDTEVSLSLKRVQMLTKSMINNLLGIDMFDTQLIKMTDKTMYDGTGWWEWVKEVMGLRKKLDKAEVMVSPFTDHSGAFIKVLYPILLAIDSLSMFATRNVLRMEDEDVGDSSRNTDGLADARAKTQLLSEMGTFTEQNGLRIMFTVHMGEHVALDPRSTPAKKLTFMRNIKFKGAPEKLTFLANNIWYISSATTLQNETTKAAEYPRDSDDVLKGDTDLMLLSCMNLRGKSGPTGFPFELVVSQSEGMQVGLTEFNYIKNSGRFGIEGNLQNYTLALCPDIALSRTKVRGKIAENPKLQRALEITSELCQMHQGDTDVPRHLLCTPTELFADLKAKGYDWDELLTTRGYWMFDNDKQAVPFLSTHDLLNMRAGTYKPYWK